MSAFTVLCSICLIAIVVARDFDPFKIIDIDGPETVADNVYLIFVPKMDYAMKFQLKFLSNLYDMPSFNKTLPTAIYVHGYLSSGENDPSSVAMRSAYRDRGDHNILTFDWSFYSKQFYTSSVIPQLDVISKTFAEHLMAFLDKGYDVNMLHMLGHSLGAHSVGNIARHLKKISEGRLVIPKIMGLDPAAPDFYPPTYNFDHISASDATFVQIIHTNSAKLGALGRTGTVDFYPNGGDVQPGCDMDYTYKMIKDVKNVCSHSRAWEIYQESVRNPEAFPAIYCSSWGDFVQDRKCNDSDIAYMGFGVDPTLTGKYFLRTNANIFHLGKGVSGTYYTRTNFTYPFGKP